MQVFRISATEAGRRLDRYVHKQYPHMPDAFLHRQLRGNGFRINGTRIRDGAILLQEGDELRVYLTDEQASSFGYAQETAPSTGIISAMPLPPIVYEDQHIIIFNKPVGMLSQKDSPDAVSLTELGREYLYQNGLERSAGFQPGVVSRLDRNTCGLVVMGKDLMAQQALSELIRSGGLEKYYYAVVHGRPAWKEWTDLVHAFEKDTVRNKVTLGSAHPGDARQVHSKVRTVQTDPAQDLSLVEIRLITGRSHQIRAQLSFEGFPIYGDPKYGTKKDPAVGQMLLAHELVFRQRIEPLSYLFAHHFYADWPEAMNTLPFGELRGGHERI